MRLFLPLLAIPLLVTPAQAGFYTGNQLLELCQSQSQIDKAFCQGVVVGTFQTLAADNAICVSAGVNILQVTDVVVKSLTDNPNTRNKPSEIEILRALVAAFPCP